MVFRLPVGDCGFDCLIPVDCVLFEWLFCLWETRFELFDCFRCPLFTSFFVFAFMVLGYL